MTVPDRPDLLVIMSDQHSAHVLGCAGDQVIRTPNLDRLAAGGVRFSSTYCPAPLCVPSRMSFLTGQMPSAIKVWTNACVLGSDVPTFAHALGAAGYETVLCGRMHFQGPDQRHGFERRLVGDVIGGVIGGRGPNFGHVPASTAGMGSVSLEHAGPGRISYQAYDEDVTRASVDFLRERAASPRNKRRPFCLVVGYVLPHCPYIAPRRLYDYYYDRVEVPELPEGYLKRLHPAMRVWRDERGVEGITPEQARQGRAAYYGLVTLLDENVGQVLGTLEDTGLAANTATVYTSDHGEMAGEHGMWWKLSFYEGSVGVPMIWSVPRQIAAGTSVSALASLIDIGPTLVDLAGGPALPHAVGRSLRPWLVGEVPGQWRESVGAEMAPAQGLRPARMVRRGKWKLSYFEGYEAPQLFNLDEDPQEMDDRAADPACAEMRDALLAEAHGGWSGAEIEALLARRGADRRLLVAWNRTVQPPDPDYWSFPPEENVFPE